MSELSVLQNDGNIIPYRPELRNVCGSILGTILLQQIIYWDSKSNGRFYKFSDKCSHDLYRDGDSWCEEINCSQKELRLALSRFAFRCGAKTRKEHGAAYEAIRDSSMVIYYTDSDRITWYKLNRAVIGNLLKVIYKEGDERSVIINTETTTENNSLVKDSGSTAGEVLERGGTAKEKVSEGEPLVLKEKEYVAPKRSDASSQVSKPKRTPTADFERLYDAYPGNKDKKDYAFIEYKKVYRLPEFPPIEAVLGIVDTYMNTEWLGMEERFIPHLHSFIRNRVWNSKTLKEVKLTYSYADRYKFVGPDKDFKKMVAFAAAGSISGDKVYEHFRDGIIKFLNAMNGRMGNGEEIDLMNLDSEINKYKETPSTYKNVFIEEQKRMERK